MGIVSSNILSFSVANSYELRAHACLCSLPHALASGGVNGTHQAGPQWLSGDCTDSPAQSNVHFSGKPFLTIPNRKSVTTLILQDIGSGVRKIPRTKRLLGCLSHVLHQQHGNTTYYWIVKIKGVENLFKLFHNFIMCKMRMIIIIPNFIQLL